MKTVAVFHGQHIVQINNVNDDYVLQTDERWVTGAAWIGGDWHDNHFYPPQPYPSWTRNNGQWEPPVPYPNDTNSLWAWNDTLQQWEQTDG